MMSSAPSVPRNRGRCTNELDASVQTPSKARSRGSITLLPSGRYWARISLGCYPTEELARSAIADLAFPLKPTDRPTGLTYKPRDATRHSQTAGAKAQRLYRDGLRARQSPTRGLKA